MQHPPQRSWRPFALGLGSFLLIVLAFLAVGHFANAAITVENVGGSLGLGNADLKQTVVNIVKWALGLLGLVAVIVMLYGGFIWLTSRGDEKKIEKAKRILINGAIGLVIILVSWAIVLFIQRFISNATNSSAAAGECIPSDNTTWGYCNLCDEMGDGIPGNDIGTRYPDPSCVTPESRDYYATWEDPADTATNVKLCQAVSAGFGGLIQTAPNPPYENDIDPGSDFSVYRCMGAGSGQNQSCATAVEVAGTPAFTNNIASLDSPDDFVPNSKYYVDVSQVRSIPPGGNAASRPIPPDGWTFLTGTENDEDPPTVAGRCSNDGSVCTADADCGAGNTCSSPTAPFHGETIQCLSPIIEVQFSEGMYPPSAMNPANLVLTRTDGQPTDAAIARIDMPTPDIIQVALDKPLVKNVTYRVTLSANNGPDTKLGYRDTCSNALDCGNGLGVCTSDGTATGATPPDEYRFEFTTADTETIDCSPIVTGITSPSNHGNQGDQNRVVITGSNFGLSGGKQVRFTGNILATQNGNGGSQCFANNNLANQAASPACVQSVSNTRIETIVPAGPLSFSPTGALDGGVVVIKGAQESPLSTATTDIQSPHISGIYPREGKAGRFISISGDNFGGSGRVRFRSSDGTVSVNASAPSCQPNNWSNNLITVQVPEGFAENSITHVQVCGKGDAACANVANVSNTSRFDYKNVDGPNLCGVRAIPPPATAYSNVFGSNDPNASLEAEGDGFGTDIAQVDAGYSALDGNVTSLIDDKHLVAAPSGTLPNGTYNFFVTVNGRASNIVTYSIPKDAPPQVVQDASCNPGSSILPSPNPYPGSTNVCRNINLQARFNQDMNFADVTNSSNVRLEQCGAGSNSTTCLAPTPLNLSGIAYPSPANTATYIPAATFTPDTWYRMTLLGANLHSASTNVAIGADYVWMFHVRTDPANCAADAVVVSPASIGPLSTNDTAPFTASATNAQCAQLTNIPGNFTWNITANPALVSLGAPSTVPPSPPTLNRVVATVQGGSTNGTSTITATLGGKSGSGNLIVQRNYCETNNDCATRTNSDGATCTNAVCNVAQRTCEPLVLDLQSGSQTGMFVNGPMGNLINVRGCFFGQSIGALGKVTFTNGGAPVKGSFAMCGPAGWTNDSIRVQTMPDTDPPASPNTIWGVQVFADNGAPGQCSNDASRPCRADVDCAAGGVCDSPLQSNSNATYTISNQCSKPDGGATGIPGTGVPILCGTNRPSGREGDAITYSGDKYVAGAGNTQAFFTQATDTATQLQNVGTGTTISAPKSLTSNVPAGTAIPQPPATYSRTTVGVLESPGNYCIATPVRFDVSCNQNSECSTGCCQTNICHPTADCTNGFVSRVDNPTGTCRNTQFSVVIAPGKTLVPGSVNSSTIQLLNGATPVATTLQLAGQTITVRPNAPLTNGTYTVSLRGGAAGIQATDGTFLPAAGFTSAPFVVNDTFHICTIARTAILSAATNLPITSDLFTCAGDSCTNDAFGGAGNQHAYLVRAYDANNTGPLTLSSATWTQADTGGSYGPTNTYAPATSPQPAPCPANETSENYCATGQNVANGSEQLTVSVVGDANAGTGATAIPVQTFLCTKPWPAAPNPWPFRDPARTAAPLIPSHDFTFGFCTDDVQGATLEDPVQSPVVSGEVRKEYFMFVDDKNGSRTGDSIGVRIIGSPVNNAGVYVQDWSPRRWYERTFGKAPTGTTLEIDGYPALREGRTVYVVADYALPPPSSLSYPAVYVLSYTDNARPETAQIFEQILKTIRFNDRPDIGQQEKTDLRNDLKRLHAMNEIVYALAAYYRANGQKNPSLETGTYLKHMTMTSWPSWQQEFGRVLGVTLPNDPQGLWDPAANPRQLPTYCTAPGFNQTTCWNEQTKLMEFPSDRPTPPESTGIAYVFTPRDPTNPNDIDRASIFSTGSDRVQQHTTGGHTIHDPPLADICTGASSCPGFNIEMDSSQFGAIDSGRIKPPADSVDPTVTIDAPPASPPGPALAGTVTFVVTVTDQPGGSGVGSVAFSIIGQASGAVTVPDEDGKYRWTWNSRSVLNGTYTLSVTATDRAGNTSAPVNRVYPVTNPPGDNIGPLLSASTPPDQDAATPGTQWDGSNVTLTATATDIHPPPSPATNNTGVARVEFYLGSSKLGESVCTVNCSTAAYNASLTVPATTIAGFPNGAYTYTVVAYDGFGNTSARTYTVTVAKRGGESPAVPPVVAIVLPSGAPPVMVNGANTDVVADATDASGIDRVEFFIDFGMPGGDTAPRAIDFNGPYSFSWILSGPTYTDGSSHTVRAVAYDRFGNAATATQNVTYGAVPGPDTQRPVISNAYAPTPVPMAGAQLRNTVVLSATLTDNQAVARGELRIDGVRIPGIVCAYTNPPSQQSCTISYAWDTRPEDVGQHTVSITAYDTAGFVTTATYTLSVTNQVLMSISTPQTGTTVQDSTATGTCARTTSRTCRTSRDCPVTSIGVCESDPGRKCNGDSACQFEPGDYCVAPREACNAGGSTGVPIAITVTDTCRADLLLSAVDIFLDGVLLTSIPNCNGTCTYNWSSKTTTSNGAHVLTAIGRDDQGCQGGDRSNITVNNIVNDTVPPTIDSVNFNNVPWGSGDAYITGPGTISVYAHDPPGGSGMRFVTIAIQDRNGTQLALQTCSTPDVLTPNPCEFTWAPADDAGYRVVVNAQDVSGNDATARTQVVNVDSIPPSLTWSSPADGSTVNSPPDVALTAINASDPTAPSGYASGIRSVVFSQNGADFSPPAAGSGSTYTGTYQLAVGPDQEFTATITDMANNTFTTPPILLTVNGADVRAPWVNIMNPTADGYYMSGTFTPRAGAGDWGGSGIRDVQLFLDGAPLGTPDAISPYDGNGSTVNTTTMVQGSTHTLYAVACDLAAPTNLCTTSSTRTFLVNNAGGNNCGNLICSGATPSCCGGPPWQCQDASQACAAPGGGGI